MDGRGCRGRRDRGLGGGRTGFRVGRSVSLRGLADFAGVGCFVNGAAAVAGKSYAGCCKVRCCA